MDINVHRMRRDQNAITLVRLMWMYSIPKWQKQDNENVC